MDGDKSHRKPHTDAHHAVSPNGHYDWVLSTQNHSSPMSKDSQSIVVDLDSDELYTIRVHGTVGGEDGEHVECVARFKYVLAVPE